MTTTGDTASCKVLTVYHDGSCPLCQREIGLARRRDKAGRLAFVDVSSVAPSDDVADGLTADKAMRRFHVQTPDGGLVSGAAAFLEMWGATPGLRWLVKLRRQRWLVAMLDVTYGIFLKMRPWLSSALGRYDKARGRRALSDTAQVPNQRSETT